MLHTDQMFLPLLALDYVMLYNDTEIRAPVTCINKINLSQRKTTKYLDCSLDSAFVSDPVRTYRDPRITDKGPPQAFLRRARCENFFG